MRWFRFETTLTNNIAKEDTGLNLAERGVVEGVRREVK